MMKKSIILHLFLFICITVRAQSPFGINLSGAEYGKLPGVEFWDYIYPSEEALDYYNSKGLKLVRLPFKWERVQPTLGGELNQDEINKIKTFLQAANDRGMVALLEMHNFGRYKTDKVVEDIIGSENVKISDIKDVWSKLAIEFKDSQNIWGYGVMNEPHDMLNTATWFNISQEIINGIRLHDQKTAIVIAGDGWSSAEHWVSASGNLKNLVDPSNNLIFEAHAYFDKDTTGTYKYSYDGEGAYPNIGVDRATPFVNWLKENNLRGFIGEYGVPREDPRWLTVLDNFLSYISSNCVNGTYWAAGPWWGDYTLTIEPIDGTDRPQISILSKYTSVDPTTCSTTTLDTTEEQTSSKSKITVSPIPFKDYIRIDGDNNLIGQVISVYDLNGKKIKDQKLDNSKMILLDNLKPGVYILKTNKSSTKIIKQ